MSITLDLPQELESELSAEAVQLGLSLPDYILRVLSTIPTMSNKPKTGAELVEYWQNEELIGTRPDIADSQAYARQLRSQAEQRMQEQV
jgi:hypothetical protein